MTDLKDPILDQILDELVRQHGCHTVIFYGSRSRGDWTAESDYDLVGFRESGVSQRDARMIGGFYLDAFIHPESAVEGKEQDFLHIRPGTVLLEKAGFGTRLLRKLDEIRGAGPEPLSEDEAQALRVWIKKMLKRIAKGDLEGNYRRAWLQHDLLECYFKLRRHWYSGPKESFRWLAENDPALYSLFEAALRPGAGLPELEQLAETVLEVGGRSA